MMWNVDYLTEGGSESTRYEVRSTKKVMIWNLEPGCQFELEFELELVVD